jgi:hypothetical protein
VTTADGSALASSLQNNAEQCVTAVWNVFGGNDMITTCGTVVDKTDPMFGTFDKTGL